MFSNFGVTKRLLKIFNKLYQIDFVSEVLDALTVLAKFLSLFPESI